MMKARVWTNIKKAARSFLYSKVKLSEHTRLRHITITLWLMHGPIIMVQPTWSTTKRPAVVTPQTYCTFVHSALCPLCRLPVLQPAYLLRSTHLSEHLHAYLTALNHDVPRLCDISPWAHYLYRFGADECPSFSPPPPVSLPFLHCHSLHSLSFMTSDLTSASALSSSNS